MPTSEAQKKANIAYNRRQDCITLRPSKEEGARIREAAKVAGVPLQQFVLQAVHAQMEREGGAPANILKSRPAPGNEKVAESSAESVPDNE